MEIVPTPCCALSVLRASDLDTIESISLEIRRLQREAKAKSYLGVAGGGERALMCIVAPGEFQLLRNLIDLQFKEVFEFDRRNGYPSGRLSMWMLNW